MAEKEQRAAWAERKRRYLFNRRLRLIAQLGGKCVDCEEDDPDELEFDHIDERQWQAKDIWSNKRIRLYESEARAGKIELRCRGCNASKGQPWNGHAPDPATTNETPF